MITAYSNGVAPHKPAKKSKKTAYSNGIVPQKPADKVLKKVYSNGIEPQKPTQICKKKESLFKRSRTVETSSSSM